MATGRRPGLAYAVGQLSRFVAKPSAKHVGTLKRVLRYLAGTLDYGIKYRHSKGVPSIITLEGFCDSDWTNDPESRKSTTGFVFTLVGGTISWMSRRQSVVALSTAEAEYVRMRGHNGGYFCEQHSAGSAARQRCAIEAWD
ncbi:Copia type Polyprotein [Phytophthora megakarya]|uniref:Copia type Polyprotein n=1 Tax=Phytophthora megakarya TaxID=4795 RepID=A0A225UKB6_9STRA|nr:Copia type Polyprotein [Phytophthora megakarya]